MAWAGGNCPAWPDGGLLSLQMMARVSTEDIVPGKGMASPISI